MHFSGPTASLFCLTHGLAPPLLDGRYMIEFEDAVDVCDYKGKVEGVLQVHVQPCNVDGSLPSEDDDMFVEDPYVACSSALCRCEQTRDRLPLTTGLPCAC